MDRVDQRGFDNQQSEFVGAAEAARLLGVKRATLYAYASRGLVRSEPLPKGRGHRYARSDLERLRVRGDARAGHGAVAAGALRWGEPVLETAISEITAAGPAYRGFSAVALCRDSSFESVAELLWSGTALDDARWPSRDAEKLVAQTKGKIPPRQAPLATLLAVAPRLALHDSARFSSPLEAELERARTLIRALASLTALSFDPDRVMRAAAAPRIAEAVAISLGAPLRSAGVIERALVLSADHELNASTFAARVVASTGADLYATVTAALAAMTGPRHGGASERVEALVDEVSEPKHAGAVVTARAFRGEAIPGFGHPLYPAGDPRVAPLLEAASSAATRPRALATVLAVAGAMKRARRDLPNLDYGLVAVTRALGLPRGAASALFALGRTAGWVAHALEQRAANHVLRPRARYVGERRDGEGQDTRRMHSAAI
ncbi:MAG TPA: citrate synthase family protein [Polyangiaceae bacterium]|jgi:citrate synthase|nr:citrate synthase family protein [Polyangiaceae bacterium]